LLDLPLGVLMAPAGSRRSRRITCYEGDTLFSLAFAYNCSPAELKAANVGLNTRGPLRPGTRLRLPPNALGAEGLPQILAKRRTGTPVLLIALLAGGLYGVLRRGPAGEATRQGIQHLQSAFQAAQPVLGSAVRSVGQVSGHITRSLQALCGFRHPETPAELQAAEARLALAEAHALATAAEAARMALARELAAALSALEGLNHKATFEAARAADLESQLRAMRLAAVSGPT
jgi:hypothetical protein